MKITFEHNLKKDTQCLLRFGKSSTNSDSSTKIYQQLIKAYGENPTEEMVSEFISNYLIENKIDIDKYIEKYKSEWENISDMFRIRAEEIFKVKISGDIKAYLTVNNRCPYNIREDYFFVTVPSDSIVRASMHELWHFYTWYKFGSWEESVGKQRYNDLKESLTVLLNTEYKDLLPIGTYDKGYTQHQKLRQEILESWNEERNIEKLWSRFIIQ